jgi:hypothetical protein
VDGTGRDGARMVPRNSAKSVIDAADDLKDVVKQLRAEARELDRQASSYRQRGDQLYAERQANPPQIRSAR